jgi:hypothetical protein
MIRKENLWTEYIRGGNALRIGKSTVVGACVTGWDGVAKSYPSRRKAFNAFCTLNGVPNSPHKKCALVIAAWVASLILISFLVYRVTMDCISVRVDGSIAYLSVYGQSDCYVINS